MLTDLALCLLLGAALAAFSHAIYIFDGSPTVFSGPLWSILIVGVFDRGWSFLSEARRQWASRDMQTTCAGPWTIEWSD